MNNILSILLLPHSYLYWIISNNIQSFEKNEKLVKLKSNILIAALDALLLIDIGFTLNLLYFRFIPFKLTFSRLLCVTIISVVFTNVMSLKIRKHKIIFSKYSNDKVNICNYFVALYIVILIVWLIMCRNWITA